MTETKPAPAPAPEEKPKPAGHPRAYPTLWNRNQIPLPWGSATRQRKKTAPRLDQTAMDGLVEEIRAALDRERP